MMRRLIVLLAIFGSACTPRVDRASDLYAQAFRSFQQGDLPQAQKRVHQGAALWTDQPSSAWYWRFRLLEAEVLIAQGKAHDAMQIVEAPGSVIQDPALEARRQKIRGHASMNLAPRPRYSEAGALLGDASRRAKAGSLAKLALEVEVLQGLLLIRTNDIPAAESTTTAAFEHAVEQQDDYWQAASLNNLGLIRIRRFRYDQAIPFFERALTAATRADAHRLSSLSLTNLGLCYYRIGDFDKALSFLERATALQERLGTLDAVQGSLGSIGEVHLAQGLTEKAIASFERALKLARSSAPWDAGKWAGNLAAAHMELKQWEAAERFNREAITLRRQTNDESSVVYSKLNDASIAAGRGQHAQAIALYEETLGLARNNPEVSWDADAALGSIYAKIGKPEEAARYFERALGRIEAIRSSLPQRDFKVMFLARLIRFYQAYVGVLVGRGDVEKALQVADSSRALLLSERLEISRGQGLAATRTTLQRAAKRLHVVFLSYWLAQDRSFLWAASADDLKLFVLPGYDRIASEVDAYRTFIEQNLRDPLATDSPAGRDLYDMLIAPAQALLPPGSHVVVVPDGPLHSLNLETLPAPSPRPHFWIEDVTLSVAPSLAIAASVPAPQTPARSTLLLVGDPEPIGPAFPRLANGTKEIQSIQRRFAPSAENVLTGSHASPAGFKNAGPERFSMIHFAAHAIANRASPEDSAVILSRDGGGYMLTARDVLNLSLHADLVTISACRSAGARVYSGEGLVGFVWAFLHAGARNVIAGLWDVSDSSTFQLMDTLYAGLQARQSPADALRASKLALIHSGGNFSKPFYWGPFQLYVGVPK
jgi:CHAT domain-containing protein